MSYTIWIDENIDSEENTQYLKELESIGLLNFRLFKEIDKAINHMKYIEFQETKVIISGRLFSEFVNKFKENNRYVLLQKLLYLQKIKKNLLKIKRKSKKY